ncbi:MAG: hypothetical protein E5W63_19170 [Mesorhizobium sp.]|nr:MAG: hypothetical protein E5W63_19170 [Mesorhizobium sp.]
MAEVTNSSLLERLGLPEDLRWLAEKYPRENWQGHANIHGMANMWLQRHDMFRELGGMLTGGIGNYREGRLAAPDFARWFAPRLNHFLGDLDGHHNVEDYQYFPAFAKADQQPYVEPAAIPATTLVADASTPAPKKAAAKKPAAPKSPASKPKGTA